MRGTTVVADLPLRGVALGEGRARAVSDEHQHIPRERAVAGEVDDDVPVRLALVEEEGIVAAIPTSTSAPPPPLSRLTPLLP